MAWIPTILFLAAATFRAAAAVAVVAEPALPAEWSDSADPAGADEAMHVLVALKRQNMNALEEVALAVSTPGHALYGAHLTMAEANAMTAAADADVATALAWLGPSATLRGDGATVEAALTVAAVEARFGTTVRRVGTTGGRSALRAADVSVPVPHDAVFGLHGLPPPAFSTAAAARRTPATVTPAVLREAYGVPGGRVAAAGARQAVAEFQGQTMNQTDVVAFFLKYVNTTRTPRRDAKIYAFHGEPKKGGDGVEAMLDVEYVMGLAPGVPTEFFEQLSFDFCADLKNWTTLLLSSPDIPLVHSVSYGVQANLTELGCAPGAVATIDGDFAKLAARGISVVISSGDSGSGYAGDPPMCGRGRESGKAWIGVPSKTTTVAAVDAEDAFRACCGLASPPGGAGGAKFDVSPAGAPGTFACRVYDAARFARRKAGSVAGVGAKAAPVVLWPSWPAGSPWVTAVGATRFIDDAVSTRAEAAVSAEDGFGSGGGFAWDFARPAYQKAAVAAYLESATLPADGFARAGRATPDVAALGTGYTLVVDGRDLGGVGGTSASAPVFAAIVSRLNAARLNAGKPPMGFLNPFIYKNQQAFTDVTVGSDKVGRGGEALAFGFDCAKGWDPVTGVGTPKYDALLEAAMQAA